MVLGSKLLKSMLKVGRPVDAWAETIVTNPVAKAAMSEVGMCILMLLFTWKFGIFGKNRGTSGAEVASKS